MFFILPSPSCKTVFFFKKGLIFDVYVSEGWSQRTFPYWTKLIKLIFYDIISIWFFQAELIQKRFYNRGTNSAAFCVIQQMSKQIPLPFYTTQITNPFLKSINSASHERPSNVSEF